MKNLNESFLFAFVLFISFFGLNSCTVDSSKNEGKNTTNQKIRVIHTSDLVRDDENTLVRLFLFANDQEILGNTFKRFTLV